MDDQTIIYDKRFSNDMLDIEDEKHKKYKNSYIPNDTYYGLGIENETYLMTDKPLDRTGKWIMENRGRERYSVDYWRNFDKNEVDDALNMIDLNKKYKIPVFINSYTFMRCDKNLQHRTMYTKLTENNAKFNGQTIHELLMEKNKYLMENFNKEYVYDGDTFEFTTLNFYKNTVNDCINELTDYKQRFLKEINKTFKENRILQDLYEKQIYFSDNYGIVNFATNTRNASICNNSTYHINITLPTKLDSNGKIKNQELFHKIHSNAIRAIQWIEPLLLACYGSPDIFSASNDKFSKGSLRLALSRYVGIGTYDTSDYMNMTKGKLLKCFEYDPDNTKDDITVLDGEIVNVRQKNINNSKYDHWYKQYHNDSGYIPQKTIGFDINFRKHYNHGIELRIFDFFPEKYLKDVINIILLVCNFSLSKEIPNPLISKSFNNQVIECIKNGSSGFIYRSFSRNITDVFDIDLSHNKSNIKSNNKSHNNIQNDIPSFFQLISDIFYNQYMDSTINNDFINKISPNMNRPIVVNHNKHMHNINKNFLYNGNYNGEYNTEYNMENSTINTDDNDRCSIV